MAKFTLKDWDDAIERHREVKKAVFDITSFEAWLACQPESFRAQIEEASRNWIRQNFPEQAKPWKEQ